MRIIAGTLKGRRLTPPTWAGLRPTSDRLRETLFNVLGTRVQGARVLDACAGTGAVGIEAISRGAAHVTFVDTDRRAAGLVRHNLDACGVGGGYTIRVGNVVTVLPELGEAAFDLVFLDPPYDAGTVAPMLEAAACCLRPGGLVVLERATRAAPEIPGSLTRTRDLRSGDSSLTFLAPAAPDGSGRVPGAGAEEN
ncbi:MAG: 16S rRNA (guanine(966)-N(2))-methyltransferase RsmD [Acidobacteria bacterium]|nr:16S rRNA (guanine(966)-N(2))-methyltransferase RsmD [Acidobacteriota bacterium]